MKTFQSTPLTLIDQTDSRKLEVYMNSNLPTVQIRNSNTGAYTPDWTKDGGLILSADVYLDSEEIKSPYTGIAFKWYRDEITEGSHFAQSHSITITTNELASHPIVTYICQVTYQGITSIGRMTFSRTDTGVDGVSGKDGTSVRILGTAVAAPATDKDGYYTITYNSGAVTAAALGDAYIHQSNNESDRLNGRLFVCAVLNDNSTGKDYFLDVGQIQGPAGKDGEDAKSITLTSNTQVFKVDKKENISPSSIAVTAHTVNIPSVNWEYNDGSGWKSTLTGVSVSNNTVTISESAMINDSFIVKASSGAYSDIFTIYKVYDGDKGDAAPIAFLNNEHISFAANANGVVSGQTVYTSVIGYIGDKRKKPTIGDLSATNAGLELIGMKVEIDEEATSKTDPEEGEVVLKISVSSKVNGKDNNLGSALSNSGSFSIPVSSPASVSLQLNWTKVNAGPKGEKGAGIIPVQVKYGTTKDMVDNPEINITWQDSMPIVPEGQYLWTRTQISYDDESMQDTVTYAYLQQGSKGASGSSVEVVDIKYKAHNSADSKPSDDNWSSAVVATSTTNPYLWTRTTFTGGKIAYSVARYGKDGTNGTSASLVSITPSALYFKSTTGANGTFEPQYIYLYPNFQNATYSSWQYSTDGGVTWASASGANGLAIGTYNSVANALRVDRASTLYTSSVTSISFRCNSTNTSVYDIVSIAKIYDVVDLQIGGRNLITNTSSAYRNLSVTQYAGSIKDISYDSLLEQGLSIGDMVTFSVYINTSSGKKLRARLEHYNSDNSRITKLGDNYIENGEGFLTITTPLVDGFDKLRVQLDANLTSSTHTESTTEKYKFAKLEKGNKATDWSPAPEDLLNEASNVNVMLSNESYFFEATASGIPTATSIVLDVVGYKGSIQSSTTVGTISGLPSAGMTATIASNSTTSTKITIAVTEALTSADYGVLTIPVTVNGYTMNKRFSWVKAKAGDPGTPGGDAVTFQVYSTNGYALSINTPTILLQTFAYVGDSAIQTGATYQWYSYASTGWTAISGATNAYYTVSRDNVSFSNSYMCKMQFNGAEYVGVVTIDDKSDENKVFTTKPSNYTAGDLWIVGSDYKPSNVEIGTLLKAQYTNKTYADADWIKATRYDDQLKDLQDNLTQYNQYFSFDSAQGVKITAKDSNGVESKYSTTISNDEWAINYGSEAVTYVDETKMHIKEAEIESPLTITGKYSGSTMLQAPIMNIGNFSLVIESNGSLSIIVKS